jgi:protocatechuate 3,4-dioxygenase beta subunit
MRFLDGVGPVAMVATAILAVSTFGFEGDVQDQAAPRGSGRNISGVIVDASSGDPLEGVSVVVSPGPPGAQRTTTGPTGLFSFGNLPAAPLYSIRATKAGYLTLSPDTDSASEISFETPGPAQERVMLRLWRAGRISGQVVDASNKPIAGAFVQLLPQVTIAGRPRFVAGIVATTDAEGRYLLSPIQPGTFGVMLVVPTARADGKSGTGSAGGPVASRPLVYPNSQTLEGGGVITLGRGEDRPGIDFYPQPVETFRISGRVVGVPEAIADVTVRLIPSELKSLGEVAEIAAARADRAGRFTFEGVPAGNYVLDTRRVAARLVWGVPAGAPSTRPRPPADTNRDVTIALGTPPLSPLLRTYTTSGPDLYGGRADIQIEDRDVEVDVVMKSLASLLVTVLPAPSTTLPKLVVVQAHSVNAELALGAPEGRQLASEGDGHFRIDGLEPGKYALRLVLPTKSMVLNGRPLVDGVFDVVGDSSQGEVVVTLANEPTLVTGTLRRGGLATTGAVVVAFPTDPSQWVGYGYSSDRLRSVRADAQGVYRIADLPPGSYAIAAIPPQDVAIWQAPAYLARLLTGARLFNLSWGQTIGIDLQVDSRKQ